MTAFRVRVQLSTCHDRFPRPRTAVHRLRVQLSTASASACGAPPLTSEGPCAVPISPNSFCSFPSPFCAFRIHRSTAQTSRHGLFPRSLRHLWPCPEQFKPVKIPHLAPPAALPCPHPLHTSRNARHSCGRQEGVDSVDRPTAVRSGSSSQCLVCLCPRGTLGLGSYRVHDQGMAFVAPGLGTAPSSSDRSCVCAPCHYLSVLGLEDGRPPGRDGFGSGSAEVLVTAPSRLVPDAKSSSPARPLRW
jgi:hypothetical protein